MRQSASAVTTLVQDPPVDQPPLVKAEDLRFSVLAGPTGRPAWLRRKRSQGKGEV